MLLKAGILNHPGIKFSPKGYSILNPKLIKVSLNKAFWVLVYTAQKQVIKYQKNNKRILLMIKNIVNLTIIHLLILFDCFSALFISVACFNLSKLFSDNDKFFKSILIKAEIREEYIICGIRYKKSNFPPLVFILRIVESVKKKQLMVK